MIKTSELQSCYSEKMSSGKHGNEPVIAGMGVDATWSMAWPNVIARVWFEEHSGVCKNSEWYQDLFSCEPKRVLNALKAEGFIVDAHGDSENIEEWVNLNIVIKRREDAISLQTNEQEYIIVEKNELLNDSYSYNSRGYEKENGWTGVSHLEHTLILTIPPKPEKAEEFANAIADYQASGKVYPFTFCLC